MPTVPNFEAAANLLLTRLQESRAKTLLLYQRNNPCVVTLLPIYEEERAEVTAAFRSLYQEAGRVAVWAVIQECDAVDADKKPALSKALHRARDNVKARFDSSSAVGATESA